MRSENSAIALGNLLIGLARNVRYDRNLLNRRNKDKEKDIDWTLRMKVYDALENALGDYYSPATKEDLCKAVWEAVAYDFKEGH